MANFDGHSRIHNYIIDSASRGVISTQALLLACILQSHISIVNYRRKLNCNTKTNITDKELSRKMKNKRGKNIDRYAINRLLLQLKKDGILNYSRRANAYGGSKRTIEFHYYVPYRIGKKTIKQVEVASAGDSAEQENI